MQAKIAKTESAIKIDGEDGSIRVTLNIYGGEETLALFYSLIGSEFEIEINGINPASAIRYYG